MSTEFKLTEQEIEVINKNLGKVASQLVDRFEREERFKEIKNKMESLQEELGELEKQLHYRMSDDGIEFVKKLLIDKVRGDNASKE